MLSASYDTDQASDPPTPSAEAHAATGAAEGGGGSEAAAAAPAAAARHPGQEAGGTMLPLEASSEAAKPASPRLPSLAAEPPSTPAAVQAIMEKLVDFVKVRGGPGFQSCSLKSHVALVVCCSALDTHPDSLLSTSCASCCDSSRGSWPLCEFWRTLMEVQQSPGRAAAAASRGGHCGSRGHRKASTLRRRPGGDSAASPCMRVPHLNISTTCLCIRCLAEQNATANPEHVKTQYSESMNVATSRLTLLQTAKLGVRSQVHAP